MRVTWIKCHATDQHVAKGITTNENRAGNNIADHVADMGTEVHGKDLINLANLFHDRYKSYMDLMKRVSRHIVDSYFVHHKLCGEKAGTKACRKDKAVEYTQLWYPSRAVSRRILWQARPYNLDKTSKNEVSAKLFGFLDTIEMATHQDTGHSSSFRLTS